MKARIPRRKFIALGGSLVTLPMLPSWLQAQMSHGNAGRAASADFEADVELRLSARQDRVQMMGQGPATEIWRYDGQVLKGDPQVLSFLDGGYLPVLRLKRGQRLRVRFRNLLPEPTIVHWHGLHMPQAMDGHPMYAIGNGEEFVYEFPVDTRAGTYWFHPHPHERTAIQVYRGLTGLLLVSDDEEQALGLPAGDQDLALVLQDRRLDARNQLVHLGGQRMAWMQGFAGDRLLINGALPVTREVPRAALRLRLFNGANATTFRLRWHDGSALQVIGTDGGLLEAPQQREVLTLAAAERLELWVDLSARSPGETLHLVAESWTPSVQNITARQQDAMMLAGGNVVASFRVTDERRPVTPLPDRLSQFPPLSLDEVDPRQPPRRITLSMMRGQAMLNGRVFGDMYEVADHDRVRLNQTEIWEFANTSMGMRMLHPMHIHNVHFRVIERIMTRGENTLMEEFADGFVDEGLKDVVLVRPGERVRVLLRFEQHTGIYLYHCHILEHEDLGMMQNFLIEA